MHISDGMLTTGAWVAGAAAAGTLVALDMRRIRERDVPKLALLASAFFAASLVHVPIGPVSVHLTLNGLIGVVAGPGAALVIAMGLLLQMLLFGHGGVTTLGVNILDMALPALLIGGICRRLLQRTSPAAGGVLAGLAGAAVPMASLAMVAAWSVMAEDPAYRTGLRVFVLGSIPLCAIEGLICGATISYLQKVQPSVLGLGGRVAGPAAGEPAGAGS